jgi:hypothetical protein
MAHENVETTDEEVPSIVRDARLDRDLAVMHTIRVRCSESGCRREGPLMEGEWRIVRGMVFCPACAVAE